VVIAAEWEQFRALDLDRLRLIMARPVIVDLRNIYPAEEMKRANFRYLTVGRPATERGTKAPQDGERKTRWQRTRRSPVKSPAPPRGHLTAIQTILSDCEN
jgi:hypothetical protein